MIANYGRLSSGCFELVVTDECNRWIYGMWSGALRYFDGILSGPTTLRQSVEACAMSLTTEGDGWRL